MTDNYRQLTKADGRGFVMGQRLPTETALCHRKSRRPPLLPCTDFTTTCPRCEDQRYRLVQSREEIKQFKSQLLSILTKHVYIYVCNTKTCVDWQQYGIGVGLYAPELDESQLSSPFISSPLSYSAALSCSQRRQPLYMQPIRWIKCLCFLSDELNVCASRCCSTGRKRWITSLKQKSLTSCMCTWIISVTMIQINNFKQVKLELLRTLLILLDIEYDYNFTFGIPALHNISHTLF